MCKTKHELIKKIIQIEPSFAKFRLEEEISDDVLEHELYNFYHNEKQIKKISSLLVFLNKNGKINDDKSKIYLKSLLDRNHYGFLCEIMSLSYLHENNINFNVEVEIQNNLILSKNNVNLDGYIDEFDIYFDIKGFGIQQYARESFNRLISKSFPNKFIMIDGNYDVSYEDIEAYAFTKKQEIICNLQNNNNFYIEELNWKISLSDREERSIHLSTGTINPYQEANNNKNFIFRKSSQFTKNSKFLLICAFDNQFNLTLTTNFAEQTDILTRALARRAFIEFSKSSTKANKLDKKCKDKYFLSQASQLLSGILFLNFYKNETWLYLNPNATHKLTRNNIEQLFNFELPIDMLIDDFEFDNY